MTGEKSIKALQNLVLRHLGQELAESGFSVRPSKQDYVREVTDAIWIAHAGFVRHRVEIEVSLDLAISLTSIVALLARIGCNDPHAATIGAELGNLVDGRPRRWTVRSELDATTAAKDIAEEFRRFGLPWLNEFSDLNAVHAVLAANDRRSWLLMPLHARRFTILLATAVLVKRYTDLPELIRSSRAFLERQGDRDIAAFDDFVGRLNELA